MLSTYPPCPVTTGEPAINPFAGCVNAVLFPDDPADVDLLGDSRFLVLNEPTFSLQTEFLQRTIPYFFELHHGKKCVVRHQAACMVPCLPAWPLGCPGRCLTGEVLHMCV